MQRNHAFLLPRLLLLSGLTSKLVLKTENQKYRCPIIVIASYVIIVMTSVTEHSNYSAHITHSRPIDGAVRCQTNAFPPPSLIHKHANLGMTIL